jgi:PAS domain S-box-containing protein
MSIYKQAFHASPIGMAMVSLEGLFIEVNTSLCEMLGFPAEELVELTFQEITHPADLQLDLDNVKRLVSGAGDKYSLQKRYVSKRGDLVWAMLHVSIVRDESGNPLHFISQIEDITIAVQKSRKLEAYVSRLEDFTSLTAHQLRAPQRTILGMAEALLEDSDGSLDEPCQELVQYIIERAEALGEIVTVLHSLSRAGKVSPTLKQVDIGELIFQAWSSMYYREDRVLSILSGLPVVVADHGLLSQCISIIMENSVKFAADEPLRMVVWASVQQPVASLHFIDNGIGMPTGVVKRYFDLFFRGDVDRPGTGVGGYLLRTYVNSMGGQVYVRSSEGEGTCVTIELPLARGVDDDNWKPPKHHGDVRKRSYCTLCHERSCPYYSGREPAEP